LANNESRGPSLSACPYAPGEADSPRPPTALFLLRCRLRFFARLSLLRPSRGGPRCLALGRTLLGGSCLSSSGPTWPRAPRGGWSGGRWGRGRPFGLEGARPRYGRQRRGYSGRPALLLQLPPSHPMLLQRHSLSLIQRVCLRYDLPSPSPTKSTGRRVMSGWFHGLAVAADGLAQLYNS